MAFREQALDKAAGVGEAGNAREHDGAGRRVDPFERVLVAERVADQLPVYAEQYLRPLDQSIEVTESKDAEPLGQNRSSAVHDVPDPAQALRGGLRR